MDSNLKLASIFGSNMVLQRSRPIKLWGSGIPSETVSATIAGRSAEVAINADGTWALELPEIAAGGPYDLHVRSDNEEVRYSNVLVGDVWVCSGQSNMEWTINALGPAHAIHPPVSHPTIRLFNVDKTPASVPQPSLKGQWHVATPDAINGFSAVGFFFGRVLEGQLDVPIGLINSSWGGTPAEAWTPRDAMLQEPTLKDLVADASAEPAPGPHVDPGNLAFANGWAKRDADESQWKPIDLPCTWQSKGMRHNGAVWFRKHIQTPAHWSGESLVLQLGAIDDFDTVYFNGSEIGSTGAETPEFWAVRRRYVVPARFVRGDDNVIAIRVFDQWGNGGCTGPASEMKLTNEDDPKTVIPLSGQWSCRVEHELPLRETIGGVTNSSLYNGMIHPLTTFGITGAIWYQGESNAQRSQTYHPLLSMMIRSWRQNWDQGNFPFLIVQLANFGQDDSPQKSAWAELREAQHQVAISEPNCGLVTAIDLGDTLDIHPLNKLDVGKRLANEALRVAYGKKQMPQSPAYRSHKTDGDAIEVDFDHAANGLKSDGPVIGFYVAGEDRVFQPAAATIQGDRVRVHSAKVTNPLAVRYAWRGDPEHTLRSGANLPVLPFRTDDWG